MLWGSSIFRHTDVPCRCAGTYATVCVFTCDQLSSREAVTEQIVRKRLKVLLRSEEQTESPSLPFDFAPHFFSQLIHPILTHHVHLQRETFTNLQQIQGSRRRYFIDRLQNKLYLLNSNTEQPLKAPLT